MRNTFITNIKINLSLRSLPILKSDDIWNRLKDYSEYHKLEMNEDYLLFEDLNITKFYSLSKYEKVDSIGLKEIIVIRKDSDDFVRIILRNGFFHALSTNSSIRLHRHLFETNNSLSKLNILICNIITDLILIHYITIEFMSQLRQKLKIKISLFL